MAATADADEDVADTAVAADVPEIEESEGAGEPTTAGAVKHGIGWSRVIAFIVLPALALVLAAGAGYLKWRDDSIRNGELAAAAAVQAARDGTVALLSYRPDTVEEQLGAARGLLTGEFRDSYTSLTNDVVIPGAKQKQIAAIASVPAAASVSATPDEAVVLLFVNQTVTVGSDPPTDTASSVRVTLEKDGDRWLISKFDPV
jgi:Mce-associated membrane protein